MRKQRNDLGEMIGLKFSKLTVTSGAGVDKHQKRIWNCICECGNKTVVATTPLRLGKTQSCGCLKTETHTIHGDHKSLEYYAWRSMRNRCKDQNTKYYEKYGGRGIKVCGRWENYLNFLSDMGRKPTKNYSLDRIDNNGDYTPENCRWATKSEQNKNRSVTVWIEHEGKKMLTQDWALEVGLSYSTLYARLRNGWSIKRALNTLKKGM